jgi:hypothetical protein
MQKATGLALLALSLLFAGCVANLHYQHRNTIPTGEAQEIIEQVFMQQPREQRPESVVFTDRYFEIRRGVQTRGRSSGFGLPVGNTGVVVATGRGSQTSREVIDRVYYDSIGNAELWSRRSYWYVEIRDKDNRNPMRVYVTNRSKAERFIDAIYSLPAR